MAQVPYSEGVPSALPETRLPDDYQHIQARPEEFGGLIARGEQQLGAGASQAAKFFGEAAADNASNQFQERATKLLYGDPNKQISGPDGKPQQDTGYFGLKGRSALDARPGLNENLDGLTKDIRDGLQTPEQQLQFDNFTRRYRTLIASEVGRHADQQSNVWYGEVNKTTAQQQIDLITTNADKPDVVAHATSDLINARVKQAQLQGGGTELTTAAIADAKRDAATAQIQGVVGSGDFAKAQRMVEGYKPLLGAEYEKLANEVRARAEQQNGQNAGINAIGKANLNAPFANPALPVWAHAAAVAPQGFSPAGLARTARLESGGNPNAVNGQHIGLTQMGDAAWDQFGQGDRRDPAQNIIGAQRLAAANAPVLKQALGRDATDAELYLAHQQGAGGASKLLLNPDARAGSLVGDIAIRKNGGDPNAPAWMFTNMWAARFNGAQGWQTALGPNTFEQRPSVRQDAYQAILNDPDLNPNERAHAFSYVHQTLAAQEIAENNTEKENKRTVQQAANEYSTAMFTGQFTPDMYAKLATDPRLNSDWKTRDALINLARAHSGSDAINATLQYGPGFWPSYKAITAPANDPSRITDPTQLLGRAGPGGDLTLAGVQKLTQSMREIQKSVDDASVHTTKAALINYAKQQLSFESDTGPIKIRDPKGEAIFNGNFIPKFEAAYDAAVKDGKNPWDFLTRDNVDKMIQGMRPKAQMDMDRVTATGEATGDQASQVVPPPLPGVDQITWAEAMATRPITQSGQPLPPQNWARALEILRANPTPEGIKIFDDHWKGFNGKDILQKLGAAPAAAANGAAPSTVPAKPITKSLLQQIESVKEGAERGAGLGNVLGPPGIIAGAALGGAAGARQ